MSHDSSDRERMLALLRRHGWNATSFQVMEPEFRYWFDDDGDGAVAYLDTGRARVVAGAPIAAVERTSEIAARFIDASGRDARRVVFFAVEPRFLTVAPMPAVSIGQQASWDPRSWDERHRGHRGLREQLRRARAKGVEVSRIPSDVAAGTLRPELEGLIARWLHGRSMPPMSFLVALEPFVAPDERRYYIARAQQRVIGLLVAVPVYDRDGWFFEDILRDPAAPNGTTELMIDAAMRDVAASGSTFVTLGLAPLAGEERWMHIVRRASRGLYNFDGLHAFKSKLRPDDWTPIFLAWPAQGSRLQAIHDALSAFAGGRPVRFAMRALLRGPAPVLALLSMLLVGWTIALARATPERWFRSRREQRTWVLFDTLMAGVLLSLSRRWRRPLAVAACAAAAADGAVTVASLATDHVRRVRGLKSALVVVAAATAPFVAAAILLGALRSRATAKPRSVSDGSAAG